MVTNWFWPIFTIVHLLKSLIINAFVDYADLLFQTYGDDVKWWVTFNEPKQTCAGGYDSGGISPQDRLQSGIGGYICAHNLLRAHAKTYRLYDEKYRATQNGKVSMVIDESWIEPASNSTADIEAAQRANLMTVSLTTTRYKPLGHTNSSLCMVLKLTDFIT